MIFETYLCHKCRVSTEVVMLDCDKVILCPRCGGETELVDVRTDTDCQVWVDEKEEKENDK